MWWLTARLKPAYSKVGLDRRSSLDSVQQALFYASLTGKMPAVVIYDTDGKGRHI